MRAKAIVKIDDHFAKYAKDAEKAVVRSLGEAAGAAIAAGRAKSSRYSVQSVQGKTAVTPPVRVPGGWLIVVNWPDFRAHWFDKGTYQHLGGRGARSRYGRQTSSWLATGPEGHEGNRGIKPINWTRAAKRVAAVVLLRALSRNMGG